MSCQLGTWLSIGSPVIAELAAIAGFDWVLFDLEHGCAAEAWLPDQLRALRGSKTKGVVRVSSLNCEQIARVLDWGADGVMIPRVESASDAQRIVSAAYHAPKGERGLSRTVRATSYGHTVHAGAPLMMVQIETVAGVSEVERIAAVEGVTTLFVGPADLNHDLLHRSDAPTLNYEQCLDRITAAAAAAQKEAGILVRDTADAHRLAAQGFKRIAIDSDLSILRNAYRERISALSETSSPAMRDS